MYSDGRKNGTFSRRSELRDVPTASGQPPSPRSRQEQASPNRPTSPGRKALSASRRGSISSSGWSLTLVEWQATDRAQARSRAGPVAPSAPRARWRRIPTATSRVRGSVSRSASGSDAVSTARPVARSIEGRYSSSRSMSIGVASGRRQRAHSPASAVLRWASASIPRLVRLRRTCPEIGEASRDPQVLDLNVADLVPPCRPDAVPQ